MADRRISELTNITGADVDDDNDELAIVDASAGQTKAITREELLKDISGSFTKIVVAENGWNPISDPTESRSTPETALVSIGGHFDEAGAAGRNYIWGLQNWITNPSTAPVTVNDSVSQGWKVRGVSGAARQIGDDGDGHAGELLSGQWTAKATCTATSGSADLVVDDVTRKGSRFCVGNAISGDHIPGSTSIVSITKDGQTVTDDQLLSANVASSGIDYEVGDIITLSGGTSTYPATMKVLDTSNDGGVISLLAVDLGNYSSLPSEPVSTTGGSGTGLTLDTVKWITGGFGNPDTITISANATGNGSTDITVRSADTFNIGLLISGSGDGGSDGLGNPNGTAMQIQSYGNAAFKRGINFGSSSLRSDGTGIEFSGTGEHGIEFTSLATLDYGVMFDGGTFDQEVIRFNGVTADAGIWFNPICSFSFGAIYLDGQNIRFSTTSGGNVGQTASEKIGFWGVTPTTQPAAISNSVGGDEQEKINAVLAALRSAGIIDT